MSTKGIIGGVIIAAVIVIALFWGYSQHKKTVEKVKAEKIAAEKYAATHPPAPTPNRPPVEFYGTKKTLYYFPDNGCFIKHLQGNWSSDAKGGEISYTNLDTGRVVYEGPNNKTDPRLPEGDYRICRSNPKAWGVEITER